MTRIILLLALIASPVAARDYEDEHRDDYHRKSPRVIPATPGQRQQMYVNVEGIRGKFYLTPHLMRKYGLRSGWTISVVTARRIAIELGADYPPDILEKLEKIGN